MHDLIIDRGDGFTVTTDGDGYPAVRIQNKAFVEEPRWLACYVTGPDRRRYLDELIDALVELRDTEPS
jgi:hypothetical protein